jgi:hypothetical protein
LGRIRGEIKEQIGGYRLKFSFLDARNAVFKEGELSSLYMKYKVVEYYALANVLICSNCHGIGHFRNKCPQTGQATCKVCGGKWADLKAHECSGVAKCIHCAGEHNSNDAKCLVVKDYRAALTRNLLRNAVQTSEPANSRPPLPNRDPQTPYNTDGKLASSNLNDIMSKKLDCIIAKPLKSSKKK